MSLSKKLTKVTPMSLTLAALLTLTVALLLFVSYLELSEPEHTLFSYKKFRPTPSPAKTSASRYGTFQNKCSKYGFSKRNVVQKDGSLLNELNAEITNITKGSWNLRTPELYATLTPSSDTAYPDKKTFHTGDCVAVTYQVEKSGKVDVTQITAQ